MGSEKIVPTWKTWAEFDAEYTTWRLSYEASPSGTPRFFHGGERLPDGSTVLESVASPTQAQIVPRTRVDMKELYSFDPNTETRDDIKGTHAKKTRFYKEFIGDIEKAKEGDETVPWVNFNTVRPRIRKNRREYPKRGTI